MLKNKVTVEIHG